jgi:AhpD family alkylhydroperoxidase
VTDDNAATVARIRIDLPSLNPDAYGAMTEFGTAARGPLDTLLVGLVQLRASQINGCRFCVDLHTTTARTAGEDERRLATLAQWRGQSHYSDRERAALAVTETVTLVASATDLDDVMHDAARHFAAAELGYLLWTIAAVNAWNRVAIASRMADAH